MLRFVTLLSVLTLVSSGANAAQNDGVQIRVSKTQTEQYERDVDEVALHAQENAIARLINLLKKYRGKRQEPTLLAKLGELQQQNASILFRIAHGDSHRKKKGQLDLTRFNKTMNQAISTVSTLIAKYPNYEEIDKAYYLRGKGHEELGDKVKAAKDYLHLVKNFPEAEQAASAYMALAEFSIEANDHSKAITYLREVEKKPESPHYPFALYKLAWSHYNLKNVPTALSYAERQISYYSTPGSKSDSTTSDNALRENTLQDVTIFYFEGFEEKSPQYSLANALPYFKKLESGPTLGKMLVRFAKLLRSHDHESALTAWKDTVLESESGRPESVDVAIVAYEYQLNKRHYAQLVETAHDIQKLYPKYKGTESFARAQKLVLDAAEGLQASIIKQKDASDVQSYSATLASLYDIFTKIVEETDERIPRVHYNLAETLFAIKDYSGATQHYRWIVERGRNQAPTKKGAPDPVADAALKAIASRYEVLKQKQLLPREIAARSLIKSSSETLDPLVKEWVAWVDTYRASASGQALIDSDNFHFETNRALYAKGHVTEAVDRLHKHARANPTSSYAVPSASLVLDSFIATEDWKKTEDLANDFLKVKEWKAAEFSKRLFTVAADSAYKQIEGFHRAKDYASALKNIDSFLKNYSSSARHTDALVLAGGAALASNDKKRANEYFSRIIALGPTAAENLGAALLSRAKLSEERFRFADAANDLKSYLMLPPTQAKAKESEKDDLRRKTLTYYWLSDQMPDLRAALDTQAICTEALVTDCDKYNALHILASPARLAEEETTEKAFDRARKNLSSTSKESRALWAIVALEGSRNLAFRDRNVALRAVAGGWDDLDPLVRFSVSPVLVKSIPRAFELNRLSLREVAPLRADERYITRRVEVIREMENAATKVIKLPWTRIRAEVLNEMASTYSDFARALSALNPPKGLNDQELVAYQETIRKLVLPFEDKGQDMRSKAFEVASRFSIEEEAFQKIAEPFFTENPSQAKKIRPSNRPDAPASLTPAFLALLDSAGGWASLKNIKNDGSSTETDDRAMVLKAMWVRAAETQKWHQVAFLMNQAKEQKLMTPVILSLVKSVSLAMAGARGEGLAELEDVRRDLDISSRMIATATLMHHSLRACSKQKTQTYYKELQSDITTSKQSVSKELTAISASAATYIQ